MASLVDIFRGISKELDDRNDKSERIVKLSRDITIESKRTISLLQRVQFQSQEDKNATLKRAEGNLAKLRKYSFYKLAQELENESPFFFNRNYTFGLQEYIEALSFLHYLEHGTLISHEAVQKALIFDNNSGTRRDKIGDDELPQPVENANEKASVFVHVSQHDYILGIMDLTGELMRTTINANPSESREFVGNTSKFLQLVYQGSQALYGYRPKELSRKLSTLLTSVLKLESYVYSLRIRELDKFGGVTTAKPILHDAFQVPNRHYNDDYDSGTE